MMEAIYARSDLSTIWKYVDMIYSQPSELWIAGADGNFQSSDTLRSMQGIRQGDPLSPLLFSVAWQTVIDGVTSEFLGENANTSAYQDDTHIVAPVDTVFGVYDSVVRRAAQISLEIQPAKCEFLYLHSETSPPQYNTAMRIDSGVIPRGDVVTVLGVPVGKMAERSGNAVIEKRVERMQLVIKRLLDKDMPKQLAFTLLQKCVQFQLDYLLRMVEPTVIATTAKRCDEILMTAAAVIMGVDIARAGSLEDYQLNIARSQLWSPVSDGGFGLRSAEGNRHIAFFAAHVGAIRDDPMAWTAINAMHPASHSKLIDEIRECVVRIRSDIIDCLPIDSGTDPHSFRAQQIVKLDAVLLPAQDLSFDSLKDFYVHGGSRKRTSLDRLQTVLTQLAYTSKHFAFGHHDSALINAVPTDALRQGYRSHLISLCNSGAGRWLSVAPRMPVLRMGDVDFVGAAHVRLYLQPGGPLEYCVCEKDSDRDGAYVSDPLHGLSCKQVGSCIIMRHNGVRDAIVTALRKAGISPIVEPSGYDASDNRRPDIFAIINGRSTFIDVIVVHPSAPSHRNKKPLAAAEYYVKLKVDKYRDLAEGSDAVIIAFVVETGGGYSDQARYLIDDIVTHALNHAAAYSASSIRDELKDTIAIAIQKGNAMAVRRCREMALNRAQQQSRPSAVHRRRTRACWQSFSVSSRRRSQPTIVSRRRRTVDVNVDLTTDDDEQLAVSPILQPVTPSAAPNEDHWATCSTDEDDDDEMDQFVIPNSQIAYVSITSSSVTAEIECIE